jgi:hypothetical protein
MRALVGGIVLTGVTATGAVADDSGLMAWDTAPASEMAGLRGGTSNENSDNGRDGTTVNPSLAGGNAALQIVKNEIGGSVGKTGSINNLNVDGTMNVNAINTGNNNTMLNQLTVIVEMPN